MEGPEPSQHASGTCAGGHGNKRKNAEKTRNVSPPGYGVGPLSKRGSTKVLKIRAAGQEPDGEERVFLATGRHSPSPRARPAIQVAVNSNVDRDFSFVFGRRVLEELTAAKAKRGARRRRARIHAKVSEKPRTPAAGRVPRCARRTGLGSQPPKRSPAGRALRSGRPAPAAARSGSAPDRR